MIIIILIKFLYVTLHKTRVSSSLTVLTSVSRVRLGRFRPGKVIYYLSTFHGKLTLFLSRTRSSVSFASVAFSFRFPYYYIFQFYYDSPAF